MQRRTLYLLTLAMVTILVWTVSCAPAAAPEAAPEEETVAPSETTEAAATAEEEKIQIFFSNQQTGHPFWNIVWQGVQDAAERYGMEVTMGGPTAPDDAESVRGIEAAIASGQYDAIIIPAIVPDMYTPSIDKAVDAGMLVITIAEDAPKSKRPAYIGTSDFEAGKAGGEKLVELTGGKANINVITGISDQPGIVRRIDGMKEAISSYPDMKVTSIDAGEGDLAVNISKLQARLVSDPDVNAFFGSMAEAGTALVTVYPQFKDRLEGTHSVVFDDLDQTLDGIRQGIIDATVVQSQYNWGFGAVYQIHRVLQAGLDVSAEVTYPPVVIVTKDNVETYQQETSDPKVWLDLESAE